jgi:hypothetical protein
MLKKYGRYYADWDDAQGQRHRKSFPTRKAALKFQTKQRHLTATKKARASAALRKSAPRGTRRTIPATSNRQPKRSAA